MNSHLVALLALRMVVAFEGCESSPAPPAAVDAGVPDVPPPRSTACDPRLFANVADLNLEGPGLTYDYVITRMVVDPGAEPPSNRGFYGFDLDGRRSPSTTAQQIAADCSHGDYFSTLDPDQNEGTCVAGAPRGGGNCRGGVDNQIANVHETMRQFSTRIPSEDEVLRAEIAAGRYAVIVRVTGVHGVPGPSFDDPSVTLRVYPVAWPAFAGCEGTQRARQTYAIDDRSLRVAGDVDQPAVEIAGCIVRGRFRARDVLAIGAPTPMVLPVMADTRLPLRDLTLRFDLGLDELTNGNLGATVAQSELATALGASEVFGTLGRSLLPLVQGFVDVPVRVGGASTCDQPSSMIGVGAGFTALRAVVARSTVSGPIPGACGAP